MNSIEKEKKLKKNLEILILKFYVKLKDITEGKRTIDARTKHSLLKSILDDYKETFGIEIMKDGKF